MPHLIIRSNRLCYSILGIKTQKVFTAEQEWILAKFGKCCLKNFLIVISNGTGFKLFTLNQVIDEVYSEKQLKDI